MTRSQKLTLSDKELDLLQKELDALKKEITTKLGQEDIDYILRLNKVADLSEIAGRSLLHFGLGPASFLAGIALMTNYYSMKGFFGHTVAHKCYEKLDGGEVMDIKNFSTRSAPISLEIWAKGHNRHHAHTDNERKDPDLNQNPKAFRLGNTFSWTPLHLGQIGALTIGFPLAMWFQAFYYNGLLDPLKSNDLRWFLKEDNLDAYFESVKNSIKDASNHVLVDYILFPLLAGPLAPRVLMGNIIAELIANTWIAYVTLGTHYGADPDTPFYNTDPQSRGEWYFRQIIGTTDIKLPKIFDHQTVALNIHIAHHLFPTLPPNRLREITPQIQAICKRYGIPFKEQTPWKATKNMARRTLRYSLPKAPKWLTA